MNQQDLQLSPSHYEITFTSPHPIEQMFDLIARIPGIEWSEDIDEDGMTIVGHEFKGGFVHLGAEKKPQFPDLLETDEEEDEQECLEQQEPGKSFSLWISFQLNDMTDHYQRWRQVKHAVLSALNGEVIKQSFSSISFDTPCEESDFLNLLEANTGLQWVDENAGPQAPPNPKLESFVTNLFAKLPFMRSSESAPSTAGTDDYLHLRAERGDGWELEIMGQKGNYELTFLAPERYSSKCESAYENMLSRTLGALKATYPTVCSPLGAQFCAFRSADINEETLLKKLKATSSFSKVDRVEGFSSPAIQIWLPGGGNLAIRWGNDVELDAKIALYLDGQVKNWKLPSKDEEKRIANCFFVFGDFPNEYIEANASWQKALGDLERIWGGAFQEGAERTTHIMSAIDFDLAKKKIALLSEKYPQVHWTVSRTLEDSTRVDSREDGLCRVWLKTSPFGYEVRLSERLEECRDPLFWSRLKSDLLECLSAKEVTRYGR